MGIEIVMCNKCGNLDVDNNMEYNEEDDHYIHIKKEKCLIKIEFKETEKILKIIKKNDMDNINENRIRLSMKIFDFHYLSLEEKLKFFDEYKIKIDKRKKNKIHKDNLFMWKTFWNYIDELYDNPKNEDILKLIKYFIW